MANHGGMSQIDECSRGRPEPKTHVTPPPSEPVTNFIGHYNIENPRLSLHCSSAPTLG